MNRVSKFIAILAITGKTYAEVTIPKIDLSVGQSSSPTDLVTSLQILVILTILTLAPSIIIMTTSFVRIIVVFHFIRQAIGLQQMPPNQVLVGMSLILTFFIMKPTINEVVNKGINPYLERQITQEEFFDNIKNPLKEFMLRQTQEKNLELFLKASKTEVPSSREETSFWIVLPAYMLSELTRGFEIGILIYIPFIIIDMIVATVLMSLGMMMLPPVMISMPFKLLLFVMVDGWTLIIDSLIKSFM
jgi:flagellar biosynthetic protein FliP